MKKKKKARYGPGTCMNVWEKILHLVYSRGRGGWSSSWYGKYKVFHFSGWRGKDWKVNYFSFCYDKIRSTMAHRIRMCLSVMTRKTQLAGLLVVVTSMWGAWLHCFDLGRKILTRKLMWTITLKSQPCTSIPNSLAPCPNGPTASKDSAQVRRTQEPKVDVSCKTTL